MERKKEASTFCVSRDTREAAEGVDEAVAGSINERFVHSAFQVLLPMPASASKAGNWWLLGSIV